MAYSTTLSSKISNNKRIRVILDSRHPNKYIRVEEVIEDINNIFPNVLSSFIANYFYFIITDENIINTDDFDTKFNFGLENNANVYIKILKSNWSDTYKVQIFPPHNIDLFDHAWDIANQLNLGPFSDPVFITVINDFD
jgi:hypothetical protein